MAQIPFPTMEEMMDMRAGFYSSCTAGYSFPAGYIQELKAKFPDVTDLHAFLDRADEGMVATLLSAYLTKLSIFTPEQVFAAGVNGEFNDLVDRARQAIDFAAFLIDLEKRHFPERIKAREEARQKALESWY